MTDFLINTTTDDLSYENGDIVEASGLAEMAQRLTQGLGLVAGEWFFDRSAGVDYYAYVLGKVLDPVALDALFVEAILSIPGTLKLAKPIDYSYDSATRILGVSYEVLTERGVVEGSITT